MKIPNDEIPTLSPYWITDNKTSELTGFVIDYLEEIFMEIGKNYTIDKNIKYDSYNSRGI